MHCYDQAALPAITGGITKSAVAARALPAQSMSWPVFDVVAENGRGGVKGIGKKTRLGADGE